MTEKELKDSIKKPSGGYFFYGEEDYLKDHYMGQIRAAVILDEGLAPFNEYTFDDDSFNAASLEDAMSAPPMMSDMKLIRVKLSSYSSLPEREKKELEDTFASIASYPDTVLVVSIAPDGFDAGSAKRPSRDFKAISKHLQTVDFPLSGEAKLVRWLARHFAKDGLAADERALNLMVALCGRGMYRLAGEAEKVAARTHAVGSNTVNADVVASTVTITPEEGAFELVNSVLDGNSANALEILSRAKRRGESPVKLLASITSAFCDLASVAEMTEAGIDKKTIAKVLGIHEYRVELYSRSATAVSTEFLADAVAKCAEADLKMKSASLGYIPLERLICSVGHPARR